MPNCFSLTRKGATEPTNLVDVDAEICAYFNVPCDPVKWFYSWYDIIGFSFAMGRTPNELRERYIEWRDKEPYCSDDWLYCEWLIGIVDYIDDTYTVDCWAERR